MQKTDTIVKVTWEIATLRSTSAEKKNGLLQYLDNVEFVYFHIKCTKRYINRREIQAMILKILAADLIEN